MFLTEIHPAQDLLVVLALEQARLEVRADGV